MSSLPSQRILTLTPTVTTAPRIHREQVSEYKLLFNEVNCFGTVSARLADNTEKLPLDEVLQSLANAVVNRLFDGLFAEKEKSRKFYLTEDWRLVVERKKERAFLSLRRGSNLVPLDCEWSDVEVDLVSVRNAVCGLLTWATATLEKRHSWLRDVAGRKEFMDLVNQLNLTSISQG